MIKILICLLSIIACSQFAFANATKCESPSTAVDKAICEKPELVKLLSDVQESYDLFLPRISADHAKRLKEDQESWKTELQDCEKLPLKKKGRLRTLEFCVDQAIKGRRLKLMYSKARKVWLLNLSAPFNKKRMIPYAVIPQNEGTAAYNSYVENAVKAGFGSVEQCTLTSNFTNTKFIGLSGFCLAGGGKGFSNGLKIKFLLEQKKEATAKDFFKGDGWKQIAKTVCSKTTPKEATDEMKKKYDLYIGDFSKWNVLERGLTLSPTWVDFPIQWPSCHLSIGQLKPELTDLGLQVFTTPR